MELEAAWFAVVSSRALRPGRPLALRRFGRHLVAWRDAEGHAVVADARCPHRGASLALGSVADGRVVCPFHGFAFDGSGACVHIPSAPDGPIPRALRVEPLPVREAHDLVFVWPHPSAPEGDPPWFPELDGRGWGEFSSTWRTHYTRAIENQLDMIHLPFVHATSIGRFTTPTTLPETHQDGPRIDMSSHDPATGRRGAASISFLAPNLWVNRVGHEVTLFVAFAPVDDDHTELLVRTYQDVVRAPVLEDLALAVNHLANRWILRQDQAVVESQRPLEAEPGGEVLVAGDGPIAAYRRLRRRLLRGATSAEDAPGG